RPRLQAHRDAVVPGVARGRVEKHVVERRIGPRSAVDLRVDVARIEDVSAAGVQIVGVENELTAYLDLESDVGLVGVGALELSAGLEFEVRRRRRVFAAGGTHYGLGNAGGT